MLVTLWNLHRVIADLGAYKVNRNPPVSSLVINACRKWAVRILGESKNAIALEKQCILYYVRMRRRVGKIQKGVIINS